uniref:Ribitol-5-phosphate transferase n=1 Tax=Eptatretus burgeri TaxID=7764 RepID=A0A8C4NKA8_EPTBU
MKWGRVRIPPLLLSYRKPVFISRILLSKREGHFCLLSFLNSSYCETIILFESTASSEVGRCMTVGLIHCSASNEVDHFESTTIEPNLYLFSHQEYRLTCFFFFVCFFLFFSTLRLPLCSDAVKSQTRDLIAYGEPTKCGVMFRITKQTVLAASLLVSLVFLFFQLYSYKLHVEVVEKASPSLSSSAEWLSIAAFLRAVHSAGSPPVFLLEPAMLRCLAATHHVSSPWCLCFCSPRASTAFGLLASHWPDPQPLLNSARNFGFRTQVIWGADPRLQAMGGLGDPVGDESRRMHVAGQRVPLHLLLRPKAGPIVHVVLMFERGGGRQWVINMDQGIKALEHKYGWGKMSRELGQAEKKNDTLDRRLKMTLWDRMGKGDEKESEWVDKQASSDHRNMEVEKVVQRTDGWTAGGPLEPYLWFGALRLSLHDDRNFTAYKALHLGRYPGAMLRPAVQRTTVNSLSLLAPTHPQATRVSLKAPRFVECNWRAANEYSQAFPQNFSPSVLEFRRMALALLLTASLALQPLGIPFWLSSGTCLGWFRQCDIIPYSRDVDIGLRIEDFTPGLVPVLEQQGLTLTHKLGFVDDSLELSFSRFGIKLDMFFFYAEEGEVKDLGKTDADNGNADDKKENGEVKEEHNHLSSKGTDIKAVAQHDEIIRNQDKLGDADGKDVEMANKRNELDRRYIEKIVKKDMEDGERNDVVVVRKSEGRRPDSEDEKHLVVQVEENSLVWWSNEEQKRLWKMKNNNPRFEEVELLVGVPGGQVWNGGTQVKSGKKFKYLFPSFGLCWVDLSGLLLRAPCPALPYIRANYGHSWSHPVTHWDWKSSPDNVRPNGRWSWQARHAMLPRPDQLGLQ